MSDLLVSLLESVAGAVAAAAERRKDAGPPPPRRAFAPLVAAVPAAVQAPAAPPPVRRAPRPQNAHEAAPPSPAEVREGPLLGPIFEDSGSLTRALVSVEIFGKPLALRGPNLWDPHGV